MAVAAPAPEKVEFTGALGEPLAAAIDWPKGATRAFAIHAHCFTCSKDLFASRRVANALTAHGFAVLRFDFTGLGQSGGDFANTSFSSSAADLIAAAEWLQERHRAPALMVGHSLGGAAVLAAATEIASVRAVATIGAPASIDHVLRSLSGGVEEIRAHGEAEVDIGGRPFTLRRQFLDDAEATKLTDKIATLRAATLVMHSPTDQQVGIENAEAIFKALLHPKSFVSLDDADHLLTRHQDAIYAAAVIAAWASRYIPADRTAIEDEGHVVVSESGEGPYHLDINASGHALTADEPVALGGTNRGATPYDLLCAALGACTTITLRMYANRKNLPVSFIETRVMHHKHHADDSDRAAGEHAFRADHFIREIRIEGDVSADERQRMLEIADRCPVHRTLETPSHVESRLAG